MTNAVQSESTTAVPRRETRVLNGVDLEVLSAGTGPTVLVLHDQEYLNDWYPFLAALATSYHVVVPSHPGFGQSALPDDFDTIDDLAYYYLSALSELGPVPAHVLGLGVGGWIAAEMAVRCTHAMHRMVLAAAVGIKVSGPTERDVADTFVVGPEAFLDLAWHDPSTAREVVQLPGVGSLDEDLLVTLLRNRQSAARFTWKPFMHNPKLRARLARIDVPTLVLWGDDDRVVTPAYGQAYARAIPGARFDIVAAAGHYPYLEQAEAFAAAVAGFLRQE
jgi:pimeloyl-ACP methyl ester carboxylesterase